MKILMLNYEFPPLGGGASNATYYLLKEFSKNKNLEVDLITSSVDKFKIEKFAPNITIHYLDINKKGNLHYQSNKDLLTYSYKAYRYSKGLMKEKDFDLCHAFFGIPCGYIAMKLGIPYIVSLRGSDVPFHNKRFYLLDKFIFKNLSKNIWKNSKYTIANSLDLKKEALEISESDIITIPNGVDIDIYKNSRKKRNNAFNILFVGRLSRIKCIDILINAFSKVEGHKKLVIVGGGIMMGELIRLTKELGLENDVIFKGILNRKELVKQYNLSDIFVLPSSHEGMSNTLLEAMSCSLPVIVTNTGGANKIVKGNGFIVKIGDTNELARAINKLKSNPLLRKSMTKKSRIIAEKMSWGKVANQYLGVYYEK